MGAVSLIRRAAAGFCGLVPVLVFRSETLDISLSMCLLLHVPAAPWGPRASPVCRLRRRMEPGPPSPLRPAGVPVVLWAVILSVST